jgi:hypothetical protein
MYSYEERLRAVKLYLTLGLVSTLRARDESEGVRMVPWWSHKHPLPLLPAIIAAKAGICLNLDAPCTNDNH